MLQYYASFTGAPAGAAAAAAEARGGRGSGTTPEGSSPADTEAMTCEEFLARHSDFLDEELGAEGAVEMRLHLAGCEGCARYDRVLRRGLTLVRELEPIQPSSDPYLGLQQYLERSGRGAPGPVRPRVPMAASVAVAGVVLLIAGSGLFRMTGGSASAGVGGPIETVASGPGRALWADPISSGMGVVSPGLPVVWRWPHAAPSSAGRGGSPPLVPPRTTVLDPGPYTPLVVEPPDYGQSLAVPVLDTYTH